MPPHHDAHFARALLMPGELPPGLAASGGDPVSRRFAIHRNTVMVSLVEALATAFPVVQRLVGEEFFHATAHAFVAQCPPRSPVLAEYGADFPDFLASFPPAAELPYLPPMARLERLMIEAYHAADHAPAARADLAGLTPEAAARLRLARHPATRWLQAPWPIVTLWRMNSGAAPLSPLTEWQSESALITRPDLRVGLEPLAPAPACLLAALDTPQTLGELAQTLEHTRGHTLAADADLAAALLPLLDTGALIVIRSGEPT